jgi:hypothetical protein
MRRTRIGDLEWGDVIRHDELGEVTVIETHVFQRDVLHLRLRDSDGSIQTTAEYLDCELPLVSRDEERLAERRRGHEVELLTDADVKRLRKIKKLVGDFISDSDHARKDVPVSRHGRGQGQLFSTLRDAERHIQRGIDRHHQAGYAMTEGTPRLKPCEVADDACRAAAYRVVEAWREGDDEARAAAYADLKTAQRTRGWS